MNNTIRWVVVALAAVLIVGLLVWARGGPHHRGDEIGSASLAVPGTVAVR